MPMAAEEIETMIKAAIPDAEIEITDLAGDGDHYAARVVSESFRGCRACASISVSMRPWRAAWAVCSTRSSSPLPALNRVRTMTDDANSRIDSTVKGNDVVLFMKGTPLFPQCGFSSRAVAILEHLGVEYASVDVLQDQGIRQGIKEYSDWPTIPQLYVKGEFVGGSDIMMEMYESGELSQLLQDQGVATAQ